MHSSNVHRQGGHLQSHSQCLSPQRVQGWRPLLHAWRSLTSWHQNFMHWETMHKIYGCLEPWTCFLPKWYEFHVVSVHKWYMLMVNCVGQAGALGSKTTVWENKQMQCYKTNHNACEATWTHSTCCRSPGNKPAVWSTDRQWQWQYWSRHGKSLSDLKIMKRPCQYMFLCSSKPWRSCFQSMCLHWLDISWGNIWVKYQ